MSLSSTLPKGRVTPKAVRPDPKGRDPKGRDPKGRSGNSLSSWPTASYARLATCISHRMHDLAERRRRRAWRFHSRWGGEQGGVLVSEVPKEHRAAQVGRLY